MLSESVWFIFNDTSYFKFLLTRTPTYSSFINLFTYIPGFIPLPPFSRFNPIPQKGQFTGMASQLNPDQVGSNSNTPKLSTQRPWRRRSTPPRAHVPGELCQACQNLPKKNAIPGPSVYHSGHISTKGRGAERYYVWQQAYTCHQHPQWR